MRLVLLSYVLSLCIGVLGCAPHPYVVCRGEAHCTPPLTHDEAIHAAQVKNAWADTALYVRPAQ
jgi:hypothetical protein